MSKRASSFGRFEHMDNENEVLRKGLRGQAFDVPRMSSYLSPFPKHIPMFLNHIRKNPWQDFTSWESKWKQHHCYGNRKKTSTLTSLRLSASQNVWEKNTQVIVSSFFVKRIKSFPILMDPLYWKWRTSCFTSQILKRKKQAGCYHCVL